MDSILLSVKKMLGIEPDCTDFDIDIIININSVLMFLNQIGIGPQNGFFISDEGDEWADIVGDRIDIDAVKTYVYLKVKLLFDPPTSNYVIEAIERQTKEIEWRLNTQMEMGTYQENEEVDEDDE
jgi:hypothetical protein